MSDTRSKQSETKPSSFLLLGCGNSKWTCDHKHPQGCVTVDVDPSAKPDICRDVFEKGFIEAVQTNYPQFSEIIFESFPMHEFTRESQEEFKESTKVKLLDFRKLLLPSGNIFISGPNIDVVLQNLELNDYFWMILANNEIKYVVIPPKESKEREFKLPHQMIKYLAPELSLPNVRIIQLQITDEMKKRFLWFNSLATKTKFLPLVHYYQTLSSIPCESFVTVAQIKRIEETYRPGFFRKKVTSHGKTRGMQVLSEFLNSKADDHVFSDVELVHLITIAYSKMVRNVCFNFNPTRSTQGESTRVMNQVMETAFAGLSYLYEGQHIDLKKELEKKSEFRTTR